MFVTLQSRFDQAMDRLLGPQRPEMIGLSVSGGGDSMALMHLAANWAGRAKVALGVATIDHGLRPESAAEAQMVARAAAALNLPHTTLCWTGWDGQGNLQDAARRARIDLLAGWRGAARHVLTGHTADDQAETFLMRLARGSGVEGLAAMRPVRVIPGPPGGGEGFSLVRPLLEIGRDELRQYLMHLGITWAEDPSNEDPRYDRIKARQALAHLQPLGLSTRTLLETAQRMDRARRALAARAAQVAADMVQAAPGGDLLIRRADFEQVEEDTRLRVLAGALGWISSSPYRPRTKALCRALQEAEAGKPATLQGCLILPGKTHLRICREFQAVRDTQVLAVPGALWDGRWRYSANENNGLQLRALGEDGLSQIGRIQDAPAPRAALAATPSLWDGPRLVAAPFAGFGPPCEIILMPPAPDLDSYLLSH